MTTSWMLARLKHETRTHHADADTDRLAPLAATTCPAAYVSYLTRVFGFESPLEAELAATAGLAQLIDAPARARARYLAADLCALGVPAVRIAALPRCQAIARFCDLAEALGWTYVLERNALLSGMLRRHLMRRMPASLAIAGSYLASAEGRAARRWRELGDVLDRVGRSASDATRIVDAACSAFHVQHAWLHD